MEQSLRGLSPNQLPAAFRDDTINITSTTMVQNYVAACLEFLTTPLVRSLLESHPNDVANDGPKHEWLPWWDWAGGGNDIWKCLVPGYGLDPSRYLSIPQPLNELLHRIDSLTLPREVDFEFGHSNSPPLRGMSPKKAHEVSQMISFLSNNLKSRSGLKYIVDAGAGQGYLSRALTQPPLSMDVLALDFSPVQTKGFERRTNNIAKAQRKQQSRELSQLAAPELPPRNSEPFQGPTDAQNREGTLLHQTIDVNPTSLQRSVTEWLISDSTTNPIPIVCVALHACGSLTPDIFRFFVENSRIAPDRAWFAAGLTVAGCCYNLMSPDTDFPLSKLVVDANDELETKLYLSYNHRSLASQSPLQWAINSSTKSIADLAIRKVVYRALLGKLMLSQRDTKLSEATRSIKIGRLPDTAYTTFGKFVSEAERKLDRTLINEPCDEVDPSLKSQLEVLHTLRIENLPGRTIQMINLFEQSLGSGRNVVLSVFP